MTDFERRCRKSQQRLEVGAWLRIDGVEHLVVHVCDGWATVQPDRTKEHVINDGLNDKQVTFTGPSRSFNISRHVDKSLCTCYRHNGWTITDRSDGR